MGMNLKFSGIDYDYNDVTIQIASDIVGASAIGVSGVKIGNSKDYDRILNLYPGNIKIKDDVNEFYKNFDTPTRITSSAIILNDGNKTVELTKSGDSLIYKGV